MGHVSIYCSDLPTEKKLKKDGDSGTTHLRRPGGKVPDSTSVRIGVPTEPHARVMLMPSFGLRSAQCSPNCSRLFTRPLLREGRCLFCPAIASVTRSNSGPELVCTPSRPGGGGQPQHHSHWKACPCSRATVQHHRRLPAASPLSSCQVHPVAAPSFITTTKGAPFDTHTHNPFSSLRRKFKSDLHPPHHTNHIHHHGISTIRQEGRAVQERSRPQARAGTAKVGRSAGGGR